MSSIVERYENGNGERRRKRILFLSYDFPPINTIACVRAYNIAKWLTRKGWEVTVVTPSEAAWARADSALDLHEELCRQGIRCMRTGHRWRSLLPSQADRRRRYGLTRLAGGINRRIAAIRGIEREAGWIGEAAKACAGLVSSDVDVVLASGPPFASFSLAQRLGRRLDRAYVLDYRDLWTGNPHAKQSARRQVIDRERSVLAGSAATIGVSPSLRDSLREQFRLPNPSYVITNGFDPEELATIPREPFGHFAIVYTGVFYPPKRRVDPLMAALRKLDEFTPKRDWAFHYYGYQGEYVRQVAESFGVSHRVTLHGTLPRRGALVAVKSANVSVVISSVYESGTLQDKGIVTGKVFDAIGLGTPMLVIAPEGSDLEGVLKVTGLGRRFAGPEIDRMADFLREAMNGAAPGVLHPEPFSWPNIADQLDGALREVLAERDSRPDSAVEPRATEFSASSAASAGE
jgi:hypothetical protein